MLIGAKTLLRARRESDVAVLHEELYEDVAMRTRTDGRPWRPLPVEASPFRATGTEEPAVFSVVEREGGALAGAAVVWGVDTHHRSAHLGLSLLPAMRGRGLGADAVRVLCRYGFEVRGLHRLQVDTLADNTAMIGAAERAGFRVEGTMRGAAWVSGRFVDEVVLGLLADGWTP
ncbi:GNAT family N-acetyltransferase [Kitasatospora sp. NPDC092948]|uniref:GNAT family N-acetyltransferase n=1 Tax=Kitasatospora sp. NPDC092948 TaxID=3364088 RepID=UPI0038087957